MATKSKKKSSKKKSSKKKAPVAKKKSSKKKSPKAKPDNLNHLKGMRKFDVKIVKSIKKNFKGGNGLAMSKIWEIVKERGYDVTYASVRNVCVGYTWKHVSV